MKRATPSFRFIPGLVAILCVAGTAMASPPAVSNGIAELVELEGHARVIVKLNTAQPLQDESMIPDAAVQRQRGEIARLQRAANSLVSGTASYAVREFKSLPYVAMQVDAAGLARLESSGSLVAGIYPDRTFKPLLIESTYQIEADIAHGTGMTGAGGAIVVIDTGAEKSHPFLDGKVVHEACFATNDSRRKGACPNNKTVQIGNDAGEPCTFDPLSCYHGTHVSGIAVGSDATMTGVAPGATLIPIQVFHQVGFCSPFTACAEASESDVAAALEYVYDIRGDYPIVAVNMSLGGGSYSDVCDADYPAMSDAIANLKSVGIATIAASGNGSDPDGIAAPACTSSAISIGAVDEFDVVAHFSNGSSQVDLLAPGTNINSAVPGGGYGEASGTSMATPHAAGAWAIMRQAHGPQDIDAELEFLQSTGTPVTDSRGANTVTLSRIRLGPAAGVVNPQPVLDSVSPTSVTAGRDRTITFTGSGFVRSSVVMADGVSIPTTIVSDTEIQAVLPKSMLGPTASSISVHVESPPLGGGSSAAFAISVLQPEISVSTTAAEPGEVVTVTLINSPGNQWDWMVLVPTGAPSSNWLRMTFVPAYETGMTWNVAMPTTAGEYEVRLLEDNTYNALAVTETITVGDVVEPPPPPAEDPAIVVSATTATTGATVTATLSNGPGNQSDSMILVAVGAPNGSWVDTTNVPAGQTDMTWDMTMPATPGDYEVRLLEDGTSNVLATSPAITVEDEVEPPPPGADPSIALSATTAETGETVTVTLTDGPGNQYDWMVVVEVGAPSSSWQRMTFVPAYETSMVWNVAMPLTPGNYEVRLLEENSYNLLATSDTIVVGEPPPPPAPDPGVAVSSTTASTGQTVTATLSDGPGNQNDWMALVAVGAPTSSWVEMTYVPAGETSMTWDVVMPNTAGEYEIRLLEDGTENVLATSATITVEDAVEPPPSGEPGIALSATTAITGETVTATLSNGPGNAWDWMVLVEVGQPSSKWQRMTFVPSGETGMTWNVAMPSVPGSYEIRLLKSGTYSVLATSETIVVTQ